MDDNNCAIGDGSNTNGSFQPKRNHLFVVGIDNYVHLEPRYHLSNAKRDAQAIKNALMEHYRFDSVVELYDAAASHAAILAQLREYEETLSAERDNLVIYFAGHGYRYRGKEFTLLSADFREEIVNNRRIPKDGIKQADLFAQLEDIKVHQLLLILDSCFSGSIFKKRRDFGIVSKDEKAPCRIGITAGKDDEVVSDGIINRNSPFATALLDVLKNHSKPQLRTDEIRTLLKEYLKEGKQKPCCEPLALDGHEVGAEFVFFKKEATTPQPVSEIDELKKQVEELRKMVLQQTPQSQAPNIIVPNPQFDFEPEMVFVKGGTFLMGGNNNGREKPIHKVTLSDFYIGKYPVTQAQWKKVMGNNPSRFKGDNLPVEMVSWDDCQEFCQEISERTGKKYRLPTEAEWEYAARGGNQSKGFEYSGSDNVNDVAWYWKNSGDKQLTGEWDYGKITANNCRTHPIGTKKANELGIHDMSGNVWEWCEDVWHDNYDGAPSDGSAWLKGGDEDFRVLRGGSWSANPEDVRAANRFGVIPVNRRSIIGFRVVRRYD